MRLLLVTLFTFLSFTSQAAVIVPKAPDLDASAYILMDAESGRILVEHNADERLPPASLTKMMTSYIAVHELETGNVAEDTLVPISEKAWRKGGSKMFVEVGKQVKLIDLLRGIIVQSGNDASVAVAEYFAGSEEAYAGWMNQYAERFGMTNTHFVNATGWPADDHYTTARDLALLMEEITSQYAARGTTNLGQVFMGSYERTLTDMAEDFHKQLQALEGMVRSEQNDILMNSVNSKWRFMEERIRNYNENTVPFLVVSYNDRIVEHLEELESRF